MANPLAALPAVHRVLALETMGGERARHGPAAVREAVREALAGARARVARGAPRSDPGGAGGGGARAARAPRRGRVPGRGERHRGRDPHQPRARPASRKRDTWVPGARVRSRRRGARGASRPGGDASCPLFRLRGRHGGDQQRGRPRPAPRRPRRRPRGHRLPRRAHRDRRLVPAPGDHGGQRRAPRRGRLHQPHPPRGLRARDRGSHGGDPRGPPLQLQPRRVRCRGRAPRPRRVGPQPRRAGLGRPGLRLPPRPRPLRPPPRANRAADRRRRRRRGAVLGRQAAGRAAGRDRGRFPDRDRPVAPPPAAPGVAAGQERAGGPRGHARLLPRRTTRGRAVVPPSGRRRAVVAAPCARAGGPAAPRRRRGRRQGHARGARWRHHPRPDAPVVGRDRHGRRRRRRAVARGVGRP